MGIQINDLQAIGLKQKTLTIWRACTKEKNNIHIPEYDEGEGYEERRRLLWANGQFQDRGEYLNDMTRHHTKEQSQRPKRK